MAGGDQAMALTMVLMMVSCTDPCRTNRALESTHALKSVRIGELGDPPWFNNFCGSAFNGDHGPSW
jgi:hypothetical protein